MVAVLGVAPYIRCVPTWSSGGRANLSFFVFSKPQSPLRRLFPTKGLPVGVGNLTSSLLFYRELGS
jgi:hypothetical protein